MSSHLIGNNKNGETTKEEVNNNINNVRESIQKLNINITAYDNNLIIPNNVNGEEHETPMTDIEYDPMGIHENNTNRSNKLKVIPIMETPRSSDKSEQNDENEQNEQNEQNEADTPLVPDITVPPSPTIQNNYNKGHLRGHTNNSSNLEVISPSITGINQHHHNQSKIGSYGDMTFAGSPSSFGLNDGKQHMINLEETNLDLIENIDGTSISNTMTLSRDNRGISNKKGMRASDLYPMSNKKMSFYESTNNSMVLPSSLVAAMHQKPPLRFSVMSRENMMKQSMKLNDNGSSDDDETTTEDTTTNRINNNRYKKTSISSDIQIGYNFNALPDIGRNKSAESIASNPNIADSNNLQQKIELIAKNTGNNNNKGFKESVDVFDNPSHFDQDRNTSSNDDENDDDDDKEAVLQKNITIKVSQHGENNKNDNNNDKEIDINNKNNNNVNIQYSIWRQYRIYWKYKKFNIILLIFGLSDFICRCMVLWFIILMIYSKNILNMIIAIIFALIILIYQSFWQYYMIKKSEKLECDIKTIGNNNNNNNDKEKQHHYNNNNTATSDLNVNYQRNNNNIINEEDTINEDDEMTDHVVAVAMTQTFSRSRKRDDCCLIMEDRLFIGVYLSLFSSLFNLIHCINLIGFIHHIDFSKWIFEQIIRILLSFILTIILFLIHINNELLNILIYIYCINLCFNIIALISIKKYIVKSIKIKLLWNDIWIKR